MSCFIDTGVWISNTRRVTFGPNVALYHDTYLLNREGDILIGENSHLGAHCFANVCHGKLTIGANVAIGPGTKLIVYSNHYGQNVRVTSCRITKDIVIGDNVFIGANSVILPGSCIGDNVVIGANSTVKGHLESNCIYAGSPSRKIKEGWFA